MQIIEDSFLALIILLNILEFGNFLPGDIDYIKKIISWTLIAYLFFRLDLPKILFGKSNREINMLIIISYLLLAFNKFTASISLINEESHFFGGFFEYVVLFSARIQEFTFTMGGIILVLLSIYMGKKFIINKESLMGIIHESGRPPSKFMNLLIRTITIFLVLSTFFIVLFDRIIEWFAISIDSPLVMLVIIIYLFYIVRYHKRFSVEKLLHKIGKFGEEFYQRFIMHFNSRKTIFTAIAGLLVLHLLIDLGIFVLPFLTGFFRPIYFSMLDPASHQNIYSLIITDLNLSPDIYTSASIIITYMLNTLAMILLLFLPIYIWYNHIKGRKMAIPRFGIAIFLSSITALFISPVFHIIQLNFSGLIGVDIQTSGVSQPITAAIVSISIFAIILILTRFEILKRIAAFVSFLAINIITAIYTYFYFSSNFQYFISTIRLFLMKSQYFTAGYLLIFSSIMLLFYITGILSFIVISTKEVR